MTSEQIERWEVSAECQIHLAVRDIMNAITTLEKFDPQFVALYSQGDLSLALLQLGRLVGRLPKQHLQAAE